VRPVRLPLTVRRTLSRRFVIASQAFIPGQAFVTPGQPFVTPGQDSCLAPVAYPAPVAGFATGALPAAFLSRAVVRRRWMAGRQPREPLPEVPEWIPASSAGFGPVATHAAIVPHAEHVWACHGRHPP
jgi:hypothetical protein